MASCPEEKVIPNLFSGTVFDVHCLSAENVAFFCLVDLPFSAGLDLLISPYTLYKQINMGNWYDKNECEKVLEGN